MNPEFDSLLRLLSSTDEPNVRLGLQIARNYPKEIEAHFGNSLQDLEALFDFLMQYEAWNFTTAFWEIDYLYLGDEGIETLPAEIGLLRNLTYLYLHENRLQTLPTEIGSLQNLEELHIEDNPVQALPEEFCNLKNTLIFMEGTPANMFIPERLKQMDNLRTGYQA